MGRIDEHKDLHQDLDRAARHDDPASMGGVDRIGASATGEARTGDSVEPSEMTMAHAFAALGLGEPALRAVAELGYAQPTPIQEQTIPALVAGRDIIAQAPTGTGKTAAFGLPIVHRLDENELRPQALVVTPTRELAIQVAEALYAFGKYREMATVAIYGGQPYERQLRALRRGVQVVVGTPGRLQDLLDRGALDLAGIRTVVLDEADEMLDMGFLEDIETLLAALPAERQTALFSATIPPRIARLAQQYLRDPERVMVAEREAVAPMVRQVQYEVLGAAKPEALMRLLDLEEPESAIVFVRTRRDADVLAEQLSAQGYLAQAIHGEITQAQRERTLDRFREKRTQILVATDVAARGLDIPEVSHIVNYDMPFDAESYVHRIGRTGRAGRSGEAITLVTPRERRQLLNIERAIHRRIERLRLPTPADVAARRRASFREEVLRIVDAGQLDPYLTLVEDLAGTRNPTELAAAAFKLAAEAREGSRSTRRGTPAAVSAIPTAPPASVPSERMGTMEVGAEGSEGGAPASDTGERPRGRPPTRRLRERGGPAPSVRLLLRVGKRQGVRPTDIVGAIANEAGIPGDAIGDIDIYDTFAFVEVPQPDAEYVRAALNATLIRGRKPDATIAEPGAQWQEPEPRDWRDERGWRDDRRDDRRGAPGRGVRVRAGTGGRDGRPSRPGGDTRPRGAGYSTAKGASRRTPGFPPADAPRKPGAKRR